MRDVKRSLLTSAGFAAVLAWSAPAAAQHARPRFEPTDLDLHERGEAEVDVQLGPMKGDGYTRGFLPDFELTLGIAHSAELEVDGTFGLNQNGQPAFLDNTLVAIRLGLFDFRDAPNSKNAWAGGVQAGPRLPTLSGARGIGLEALAIVGRSQGRLHVFLQAGWLVDSAQRLDNGQRDQRPSAFEAGIDVNLDLDDKDKWSLEGDLGGQKFFSDDDDQIQLTIGPQLQITKAVQLSAVGFGGLLKGGDRLGLLLGMNAKFKAF